MRTISSQDVSIQTPGLQREEVHGQFLCDCPSRHNNFRETCSRRRRKRQLRSEILLFGLFLLFALLEKVSAYPRRHWLHNLALSLRKKAPQKPSWSSSIEKETEDSYQNIRPLRETERSSNFQGLSRSGTTPRSSSFWSSICSAFVPVLRTDPSRLGRYAATCCQVGILAFLAHAIFKVASEILHEINVDSNNSPTYSNVDVQNVLEFCRRGNTSETIMRQGSGIESSMLLIARRLQSAGLPLQTANNNDDNTLPSVESVMMSLTLPEIKLMEQCLWTPPANSNHNSIWDSIIGLQSVKERLMGLLTLLTQQSQRTSDDLTFHQTFSSLFSGGTSHDSKPRMLGALLYGPPGCGKTQLVKGLASMAHLPCLVVKPSILLRKFVGDTNLQVRSLFSLAAKLSPCIICIDELDGLLRERSSENEHDVNRELKTEFVQWWDGMMTVAQEHRHPILVVGATNRPFDVDPSVLRRLSQSLFVCLPSADDRMQILALLLKDVPTEPNLRLSEVVKRTEGYSPSDLVQVLQTAALSVATAARHGLSSESQLTTENILSALQMTPPTVLSPLYRRQLTNYIHSSPTSKLSSSSSFSPSADMYNSVTMTDSGASKWETPLGTFYNIGVLEIDNITFDFLAEIVKDIDLEDADDNFDSNNDDDSSL